MPGNRYLVIVLNGEDPNILKAPYVNTIHGQLQVRKQELIIIVKQLFLDINKKNNYSKTEALCPNNT